MRRFRADKKWTKEMSDFLAEVMRKAGARTLKHEGMFAGGAMGFYRSEAVPSLPMWSAIASNAENLFKTNDKKPEYSVAINRLSWFLSQYGVESKDCNNLWKTSVKQNVDLSGPLNYLGKFDKTGADPDCIKSLDSVANRYPYKDLIDFVNLVDLSNATERACANPDAMIKNANDAMTLIESSFRVSGNNSNISGLMYKELKSLVTSMNKVKDKNLEGKDLIAAKQKIAVSMDRLDLLTTKYLDHKAKGFNDHAVDKIKAAALIKNMVHFCYGEKDAIEAVDGLDTHKFMDDYNAGKVEKAMSESGPEDSLGLNSQLAANDQEIRGKEVVHDSTLKRAIAHKGEDPKVEEPFLQMR